MIDEKKYNEWFEYLKSTKENISYSQKRTDLLIISISGGGLYVLLETLREFKTGNVDIENINILIVSGVILLTGIVINFISQITSYHANRYEEEYINLELNKICEKKKKKKKLITIEQKEADKENRKFNKATNILNYISIILMLLGVTLLVYFNYSIF